MKRLNYQHLYYFWTVAKSGSIKSACETLGLAQPTISGQLALFQKSIGCRVFRKEGRTLVLTESGRMVFNYAEEIFSIGTELSGWLSGKPDGKGGPLTLGVSREIDTQAIAALLSPILDAPEQPQLFCFISDAERLQADLRLRICDLALLPGPAQASESVSFSRLLARLDISLFAPAHALGKYLKNFPQSLQGAPIILPGAALRKSVETWLQAHGVEPEVKAEIGASELAKSVAASCGALVFAPTMTRHHMRQRYDLEAVGVIEGVEERIYAVSNQRKIRNAAAARIIETGLKTA